jgi:hypothetical protein
MWDFKFVGYGNKFATVPVAGGFFHGQPVRDQGYGKHRPTCNIVGLLKIHREFSH